MTPATATARTTAPKNRYPGPCAACSTHVRAWSGTAVQPRPGARWIVYCAAHSPDADAPANDHPPASAPAGGDAPPCSERAALAAVALYRHAVSDKRAPEGGEAVDVARMLAALAVWRSGSSEAARALADATPAVDVRLASAGDDLVGEILGRVSTGEAADSMHDGKVAWHGLDGSVAPPPPAMVPTCRNTLVPAIPLDAPHHPSGLASVSNADAFAAADALAGPPVDSPTSRAYASQIPDGTPGPARLAARFPIHPAPAPKRERASKGAGRWAHRKGNG